jgi:prepilin-type N-terminal cleavage/methylation domain-containing protein/prepilin-type processing-associated H-X9-DG protein
MPQRKGIENMQQKRAFTLVEQLVVIAIIAVLLAVLLPSLARVKEVAKRLQCASSLKGLGMAFRFYGDKFDRLPLLEYNTGKSNETQQHPYWAFRDGNPSTATVRQPIGTAINWGCVYKGDLIDNTASLYCHADPLWKDIYKAYGTPGPWGQSNPLVPTPDPRIKDTDTAMCVRVTYTYWPQSRIRVKDTVRLGAIQKLNFFQVGYPEIALKVSDLDSNKAMSTNNGGHSLGNKKTNEDPKADMGYNALFGDGHVKFNPPPHCMVGSVDRIMTLRQENEASDSLDNSMYLFMSKLEP